MKVLLIDPPGIDGFPIGRVLGSFGVNKADQSWPPYDLQILAGYCKKNGHLPKIVDANNLGLSLNDIKREIAAFKPDWLVYLTCFQSFNLDVEVARTAKETDSSIRTACISLSMLSVDKPGDKLRDFPYLDYIPWGEGELSVMQLIDSKNPADIEGLCFRKENGEIVLNGTTKKSLNLDEFGIPVQEGMPFHIYKCPLAMRTPMAIVSCSRGCINQCVHCQAGAFHKSLRYRSVESVLEELRILKSLGIREIKFYDCSLPSKRDFIMPLTKAMIEENFGFTWHCNARADRLDEEILELMKRSGCHTISIGSESAVPEILKGMHKNETVEEIEEKVRLVKKKGMRVLMYLTFGLEGETEETMKQSYKFVEKLKPDYATFGIAVPAPGTPFYDSLNKNGFLTNKTLHLQDPMALPGFNYPNLSGERILSFTRQAYRKYYFSPNYILRRILSIKSLYEAKSSALNALAMIRRYVFGGLSG